MLPGGSRLLVEAEGPAAVRVRDANLRRPPEDQDILPELLGDHVAPLRVEARFATWAVPAHPRLDPAAPAPWQERLERGPDRVVPAQPVAQEPASRYPADLHLVEGGLEVRILGKELGSVPDHVVRPGSEVV